MDVLLVEDEPADSYLIQQAITDWNPSLWVWLLSHGDHALPFLRQEPPFGNAPTPVLILLDLQLPGCDGHDILAELRSLAPYRTTPVVVISGSERAEEEPRCLALGANAYVQKAWDTDTYVASIQAMMRDWLGAERSS